MNSRSQYATNYTDSENGSDLSGLSTALARQFARTGKSHPLLPTADTPH